MLSSGELEHILSPDPNNDDPRIIVDTEQAAKDGAVLYCALDSLSDKTVSAAVGSILLADFASLAGRIYNSAKHSGDEIINLMVDEASEIVESGAGGMGLVQLLNKGRGAGYRICCFAQSVSDWVKGLGSEEAALQVLGNTNNTFSMRITGLDTQEYVANQIGEIPIKIASYQIRTGSSGNNGDVTDYSGAFAESLQEEEKHMFPEQRLGELPNFEYMGIVGGGLIIKGRYPIVVPARPK
ncbi:hypothetical protein A3715_15685 [Oleiphilus sp. HI0009]|nr:hypothetical protein A3715_15685 [Oleiphilus sp. HI0009]